MNEITIKKLARDLGISVENLITQLNDANVTVKNEDDTVTGQQQLQLMKQNKLVDKSDRKKTNITLEDIYNAKGLLELNDLLTQLMAIQQIQSLIKESNLGVVVDSIIALASKSEVDQKLLAAAMLGRLAAVARGRENQVFERIKEVIFHEPPSRRAGRVCACFR